MVVTHEIDEMMAVYDLINKQADWFAACGFLSAAAEYSQRADAALHEIARMAKENTLQ